MTKKIAAQRLMQANTVGELHDHVHYERESCKSIPACQPLKVDVEINGQGFFTITSRTGRGHDWCSDNVQFYSAEQCCTDDQNMAQNIAEGATESGLLVSVNGFVYLKGGLRGETV